MESAGGQGLSQDGFGGWKLSSSKGEVGGSRMWSGEACVCVCRKALGAQQEDG